MKVGDKYELPIGLFCGTGCQQLRMAVSSAVAGKESLRKQAVTLGDVMVISLAQDRYQGTTDYFRA
jgi:hypothetical protein